MTRIFYHVPVVESGGSRTLRLVRKSSKRTWGRPLV